jgi:hypothetical protein
MPRLQKKYMERQDQRSPIDQQSARLQSRNENENKRGAEQDRNKLQQQDKPLKNNDRDVDPEDPRHSSLSHR